MTQILAYHTGGYNSGAVMRQGGVGGAYTYFEVSTNFVLDSVSIPFIHMLAQDGSFGTVANLLCRIHKKSDYSTIYTTGTISNADFPTFPYGAPDFSGSIYKTIELERVLLTAGQYTISLMALSSSNVLSYWVGNYYTYESTFTGITGVTAGVLDLDGDPAGTYSQWSRHLNIYGDPVIPAVPYDPAETPVFPETRPDGYDPDQIWVPPAGGGDSYVPGYWDDIDGNYSVAGGGRWGQSLVAVGKDLIYYESL